MKKDRDSDLSDQQIAKRRDDALRKSLNTPPKQHKDMKKGKGKAKPKEKKRQDHPTASERRA